jgi:small conductance mechanosensitive channel
MRNPFEPEALLQWVFDHAPKLFTILLGTLALHAVMRVFCKHIAQIMARTGSRGTQHERENRALTLVSVFRNTASLIIVGGGILMALDQVGIPIMPLMGGAAVLGLAVAIGAQNLVRDYFSGFMVLMEDQYGINDVVKIGDISGVVEKITLRMTVLRDLEGIVHFIPHGTITRVSNMTHGWSRAVLEVNVSYKEDSDHVMRVLMDVARELRKDPVFGPIILDEPEMLGVDRLGDYAVVLKLTVKTHPLKRWPVKRELLRRIKQRFDALHIEIPFPHRTIYTRSESDALVTPPARGDKSERKIA